MGCSPLRVTALKLDVDWVVISACSWRRCPFRLARAFFYAGASALLVFTGMWTAKRLFGLITKSFDALKTNPKSDRAEALRRAMAVLISGGFRTAHASARVLFVAVGEGGSGR